MTTNTPAIKTTTINEDGTTDEIKRVEFEDFIILIGEFGRYQKILFCILALFSINVAFAYFGTFFMTVPKEHWCKIPDLEALNLSERLSLGIPSSESTANGYQQCSMYNVNFTQMVLENRTKADPTWPTINCQYGWEFNNSEVPYATIVEELEWVCDNDSLPSIAQAIFFIGAIGGGILFGWISDKYGRIPALLGSNLIGFAAGIVTPLVTSFWQFALTRFVIGFSFDNCFTMMYILMLEYVGPRYRNFAANMPIAIYFTFATMILPWLAYYIRNWQLFCVVTAIPMSFAIVTPWIVPESAMWLSAQGKVDRAISIMKKFEHINKAKLDVKFYEDYKLSCQLMQKELEENSNYSILDLFKTPRLRKITILLIFIWMIIAMVYDGHVRSVGGLGLDVFVTFTVACATEFPADTFLTLVLDVWGRRWMAFGTLVISGIFSILSSFVAQGVPSASLAIIGRFFVNISYNIGLLYAAELLPTVLRGQGITLIHNMGYVASILSPFIVYLGNLNPALPLIVLGIIAIVGGSLSLFLPETLNAGSLPQTLQDGEDFGKDQGFCHFPCIKKREYTDEVNKMSIVGRSKFYQEHFERAAPIRVSQRASIRGEIYRSSLISRSSIRNRSASNRNNDATKSEQFLSPPELMIANEKGRY